VGFEGSRSEPERHEAERSEAAGQKPTLLLAEREFGSSRRDQTGWLV
ncbi:MAG: hypothetical protein GY696_25860, partial [Gammaproteobacteria bacterium]|nr:hypothetical protein [Gammaproteobacteria bacterium]